MLIFDLTTQYIFAFFLLIYTANYINFLGYNVLIRRIKTVEGPELQKRTNLYFYSMNVLYIVNFLAALNSWYGPWCTPRNLYPPCMTFAALLYVINYFYHVYMNRHDYFLKWENVDPKTARLVEENDKGVTPSMEAYMLMKKKTLF